LIGRPNPERLRGFLGKRKVPLDDRGHPITPREREVLGSLEIRLLGGKRRFAPLLVLLPLGAYLALAYMRFRSSGVSGMFNTPFFWIVAAVIVISSVKRVLHPPGTGPAGDAISATSAALGHCGACGYNLLDLRPADDGCVQCPECGAAWHIQRRTHIGLDPERLAKLVKAIPAYERGNSALGTTDDRGVRLVAGYQWPRGTLARPLPPSADPAVALFRRGRRKLRRWCFIVAGVVWLAYIIGAFATGGTVGDVVYVAVIAAIVLALIALLVSLVSLPARKVRALALQAARCPECYTPLDVELVCFDGCTVCRGCRAAWDAADIQPEPAGSASPA